MSLFSSKLPNVSVNEVLEKLKEKGSILIDVREDSEYKSGHAKDAKTFPLSSLNTNFSELKNYDNVYVICQSGGRSSKATEFLIKQGINAINVSGGTSAWHSNNLPME